MKQTLKIIAVSALITAALIKGVPALAEPAGSASAVVSTSDLDLASESGQQRLEQRLTIAAHEVCDTASAVDLKAVKAERDCRASVSCNDLLGLTCAIATAVDSGDRA